MNKKREGSIELLRVFATSSVMVLHINLNLIPKISYLNSGIWILYILESISISAVNIFILITGYFMCNSYNRSCWKPAALIAELIAFKVAFYFLAILINRQFFSVKGFLFSFVPNNYYVVFYVILYFISPYFNIILSKLSEKEQRKCIFLLLVLFSIWPTLIDLSSDLMGRNIESLSSITREGSAFGYNIVQFSLMYLIGGYFGLHKELQYNKRKLFCLLIAVIILITMWAYIAHNGSFSLGTEYSYCNPLVILSAVLIFLLFQQWKWKGISIINRLARASYTVYLLHGRLIYRIPFESIINHSILLFLVVLISVLLGIYVLLYFVYYIWDYLTKPFFLKLAKEFPLIIHTVAE